MAELWAANGQAEQEAKGRVETTSRSLNIFFSSISNVSSKKIPKNLRRVAPENELNIAFHLSIHSFTHSLTH